jgi:Arc/MetJ-type ribon-helix-helix transcriptional regulator
VERPISVRLDEDAEEALRRLTECGRSRSEAIRDALVAAAARLDRRRLAAEAAKLARDERDRLEIAEVAAS